MNTLFQYFKPYKDLKDRIKELKYELEETEKNMYYVNAVSYSDIPKTTRSGNDKMAFMIQEKDDLIKQISELEKQRKSLEESYIKDIYTLNNAKHRTVIRAYYLNGLNVGNIADLLNVSTKHVYKIKREAESEFCKLIQNDTN